MCPVCFYCKEPLPKEGFVYIMGGASIDYIENDSLSDYDLEDNLYGYLDIGLHSNPDINAVDYEIIKDVLGGQFDISFCSFCCLKQWFLSIVQKLENQYTGVQLPKDV
jgi:hypothetical protein